MDVAAAAMPVLLDDTDFKAEFNNGRWTVNWKWADGVAPKLENYVTQYAVKPSAMKEFNTEVHEWIKNGWLAPWDGPCESVLQIMAVVRQADSETCS